MTEDLDFLDFDETEPSAFDRALTQTEEIRADFPKYLQAMGVAEAGEIVEVDDEDDETPFRSWACGCRMRKLIPLGDLPAAAPRPCGRHRRAVLGDA